MNLPDMMNSASSQLGGFPVFSRSSRFVPSRIAARPSTPNHLGRVVTLVVVSLAIWGNQPTAGGQPPSPDGSTSGSRLDEELLEDDATSSPPEATATKSTDHQPARGATPPESKSEVSNKLLKDLSPLQALERVAEQMLALEQQLAHPRISIRQLAEQDRILAELDQVIESLRSRQQKQNGQNRQAAGQQAATGQQQAGNQSPSPDQMTDDRLPNGQQNDRSAAPTHQQHVRQALADYWGHLPERLRTQMQNSSSDKFLPQYRELIEAYYRRLAEDQDNQP
jgi:hypothetical protein